MKTIVIVDDSPWFRAQAKALLIGEGFDVVGEAADGASAIDVCRDLRPEIVLLDIGLPDADGFAIAERLVTGTGQVGAPPRVVLTSSREEAAYRGRLVHSPAVGFIRKDDLSGAVIDALARSAS